MIDKRDYIPVMCSIAAKGYKQGYVYAMIWASGAYQVIRSGDDGEPHRISVFRVGNEYVCPNAGSPNEPRFSDL